MSTAAVDGIILTLGWWGPYQKQQFIGLNLHLIVMAFHIMSIMFIGREAKHTCAAGPRDPLLHQSALTADNISSTYNLTAQDLYNTTIEYKECSIQVKNKYGKVIWTGQCPNGYHYSEPRDRTIVSEWDLVCDKETFSDVTQSVFAIGMAVGASFFPAMADRYGRKPLYMATHLLLVTVTILAAFAPNFVTFATLKFFTGAANQGLGVVAWVMTIELLPTKHRALITQAASIVWPVGLLNLGLIGWLTRDLSWRTVQLISVGLSAYIIVQWWMTDETLRWLIANNKIEQARQIIRRAAKKNKASVARVMVVFNTVMNPQLEQLPLDERLKGKITKNSAVEEVGFLEALKNRNVLKVTAISSYMFFAGSCIYYGLIMTSGSLVDDLYLGFTVNVLVEIPAGVVYLCTINRASRRRLLVIYHSITGVCLLVSVLLTTIPIVQSLPGTRIAAIVASLLGKFAITMGTGVMWIYTPECFPTNIRTICFGIACLAARTGSMVSPYARTVGHHVPWLPGLVFSVMCFLILGLTRFLPETFNRELPQTIADMEKLIDQQPHTRSLKSEDTKF